MSTVIQASIAPANRRSQSDQYARGAQFLIDSRLQAGLTLRAAATLAGTSHATLSAYEQGHKSPTLQTFLRVVESYGYAVDMVRHKRIRSANGLPRGDELIAALRLAEQFPARVAEHLDAPVFGRR